MGRIFYLEGKMTKRIAALFFAVICLLLSSILCACNSISSTVFALESEDAVTINFDNYDFPIYTGRLTVGDSSAYTLSSLEIVCDDPYVDAAISAVYYRDGYCYTVKPKYNGKFSIYIQTKDKKMKTATRTFMAVGGKDRPLD